MSRRNLYQETEEVVHDIQCFFMFCCQCEKENNLWKKGEAIQTETCEDIDCEHEFCEDCWYWSDWVVEQRGPAVRA